MNTVPIPKRHVRASLSALLIAMSLGFGILGRLAWLSRAVASSSMQVVIQLTTASEAALGVPIQYKLTITDTDVVNHTVSSKVDLIAPDGTTFNVLSRPSQLYTPNQSRTTTPQAFTSSTYTSQTGAFTLHGYVTDSTGTVLGSQSIGVSIVAVPADGFYANIGGVGPDTALLGMKYDFQSVTANLGTTSQTLTTQYTLVYPDSTQVLFSKGFTTTISAGGNVISSGTVTTSQFTTETGVFGVRVDVLNGSTVIASQTHNITRNTLPATFYAPAFTDMTTAAGVNVQHMNVICPRGSIPPGTALGAGAAVGDYDGDGWEDIYAVDSVVAGHLWHNNHNGTFTDMATAAGLPVVANAVAANFVDYDNDGNPDLLILTSDGMNRLFHSNGVDSNGNFLGFTDVTSGSGLQNGIKTVNASASFGDYDGDGFLDLYIAVHGDCSQSNTQDHLYHNEHGSGIFTDVSNLLNNTGSQLNRLGFAVLFFDYNQDGKPDIYVGNDLGGKFGPNVLWKNNGASATGGWSNFTDVSASTNTNVTMSAMGIAVGDYNRDGLLDLYVTNIAANVLLQQIAGATFTQAQSSTNTARASFPLAPALTPYNSTTWGVGFYDLNNDGWEDLFLGGGNTGGVAPAIPNALLVNNQDGTFLDLTLPQGLLAPGKGARTVVFGDFNNDGFIDIFETESGRNPFLYINNGKSTGNPFHYLRVKLIGNQTGSPPSNRDAVGARLVASVSGASLVRTIFNGGTFEGNSDLLAHFGLGAATQVDTLTITWPSGKVTTLTNVPADQVLTVTEQ